MQPENRWISGLLLFGMLAGVGFCLWRITRANPTENEVLLLSFLLTLFSVIGSWIASQYYSASSFNRNQRVFALKAAEKVTNLSNEFDRLAVFLQQELKEGEYENPQEALLAKNIRIESAVHIINTLKSLNEKSLSDWQGVIGDELSAQREEQEEREETLRELLERVESLQREETERDGHRQLHLEENGVERRLRREVGDIKDELRLLAAQVTGVPIKRVWKRKQQVERECPSCGTAIHYAQRTSPDGVKAVNCKSCGSRFISREVDGDFILQARKSVPEELECPGCQTKFIVPIDPVPGSSQKVECSNCHAVIAATRTKDTIKLRVPSVEPVLEHVVVSEDFLSSVEKAMGPQPWPKGQAKIAATTLRVSPADLQSAIRELTRRGVFKPQIDGIVYVPETDAAESTPPNGHAQKS